MLSFDLNLSNRYLDSFNFVARGGQHGHGGEGGGVMA